MVSQDSCFSLQTIVFIKKCLHSYLPMTQFLIFLILFPSSAWNPFCLIKVLSCQVRSASIENSLEGVLHNLWLKLQSQYPHPLVVIHIQRSHVYMWLINIWIHLTRACAMAPNVAHLRHVNICYRNLLHYMVECFKINSHVILANIQSHYHYVSLQQLWNTR